MFVEDQPVSSDRPTVRMPQSMNQLANSTFYTSGSKDALFNFSGASAAPTRVPFEVGQFHPLGPREKRKSESSSVIVPGSADDVPPRKLYISEAAMSNHFARMNLTHPWSSSSPRLPPTTSAQSSFVTATHETEEMTSNLTRTSKQAVDVEANDAITEMDKVPAIEISSDLKEHLRNYPPDRPVENIIREILTPKISLAIVPFDPSRVPSKFRQDESSDRDETRSPSPDTASSTNPTTAEMDVEPIIMNPAVESYNDTSNLTSTATVNSYTSVDSATHFWTPPSNPNASSFLGQRNVFSYPLSNPNDRRFLYPQAPFFSQQPRMQGSFFPPF